jgi:EamA-like transporter family
LGFVGVVLLNLGSGLWASPFGAIILLIAPICWAFGSAWSHHLQLPSGLMASAAQMFIGGIFVTLLGLILGQRITSLPSAQSLLALLYLIVFGSLIAYSAYGFVLRRVRPALATCYAYVCKSCRCGMSWGGTRGRERHSVDDCGNGCYIDCGRVNFAGAWGPVWNASRNR